MLNHRHKVFTQRELRQQPEEGTDVALAHPEHLLAARERGTAVERVREQDDRFTLLSEDRLYVSL